MKEEPNYYAIIPANIRYDENLIPGAKLLYGEITALSNQKGYCWASDMYFANLYKISKKTVQRWLSSLEEFGYITRDVEYKEGSNEIVRRYVRLCPYPMDENDTTPMDKKVRDNNTSINTTVNNTSNKNILSSSDEQDDVPYKEIVDYLNLKTSKSYKHSTSKTKSLIKARWNEGFRVDDFKKVIDNKCFEWIGNPGMAKYLRPETLFGTKFEGYLNENNLKQDMTNNFENIDSEWVR